MPPSSAFLARACRAFATAMAIVPLFAFTIGARTFAGDGNPDRPDRKPPFSAIHVIGDSLLDTGRASRVLSQLYGTAFPPPPYAAGRVSNGPVWIEYLAPQLRLDYDPLDNLSWAGANTGRLNVYPGLPGMLDELDELLAGSPRRLDKKALYVVFGGSNDFLRILSGGVSPAIVVPEGVANLGRIVRTLHASGADNIVVVDLPDIGLTPRALAGPPGTAAAATAASIWFNALLQAELDRLGFPVVRVSAFQLLRSLVTNPSAYGFTQTSIPGIAVYPASADTFVFWDDVHPTTRTHRFVAAAVFKALEDAGLLKQLIKHPN